MTNEELDTVKIPVLPDGELPARAVASARVEVDLKGLSHRGKVRTNNEDHFFAARFDRTMQTLWTNLPPGEIAELSRETVYGIAVADGMGGETAGEVASRKAITLLIDLVLQTPDWIMLLDAQRLRQVERRMEQRFQRIHEALNRQAQAEPELFGMGTTLTVAVSHGADLLITHVGDSRAYLFRQDQLTRLTHDQTRVQELVDAGSIRPEDAATHPLRNRLTGALSTRMGEVRTAINSFNLSDGDQLLLCTDGLTDMVPEPAIADVLRRAAPAADACSDLLEMALKGGGSDNITVVLARYHLPE